MSAMHKLLIIYKTHLSFQVCISSLKFLRTTIRIRVYSSKIEKKNPNLHQNYSSLNRREKPFSIHSLLFSPLIYGEQYIIFMGKI